MINLIIKLILIFLIIFSPLAFGSFELWAFSLMELGILLILILWTLQTLLLRTPNSEWKNNYPAIQNPQFAIVAVLLCSFLLLVLFQTVPLPSGILKVLSPKTYELWNSLSVFDSQPSTLHPKFQISFVPFLTQVEFFKWFSLMGLFILLLFWKPLGEDDKTRRQLIMTIMMMGVVETLYGIYEFFSGHRHVLYLDFSDSLSSVTGTFINRNQLAGYLSMVIPLSIGFLFSREVWQRGRSLGWRHQLTSLDGKTFLIGFSVIVMILGLLFSASRMGIVSLLLSFSLFSLLFRSHEKGQTFSKTSILILGLAILWAAWIGLDAVVSRFFTTTEDLKTRWNIWVDTFQILKDFPLLGSGLGTFLQIFPMYRSFHTRGLVTHAENDFLQLASEVGILGIGLLIVLILYFFVRAVTRIRSLSYKEPERYLGMGGVVGILALMFHSLVERNIQMPANAFLYVILWAIVLNISPKGVDKTKISITQ
ncbi:MAG: O-antigen ligase family protein [Syntrophaceae bacterium]|nr:O-antigen ligase family protein [Syntrophaceae bacterium]